MEKMTVKDQVEARANLYNISNTALDNAGLKTQIIADGVLIDLGNGQYAKGKFSICDATKFNVDDEMAKYQEKLERAAATAAKHAEVTAKKSAKEAERAAKAKTEE